MTNREEVAERLRVYATDFDFGDSNPIWYVEKAVFNDIRIREQGRVFSSLADLIDPTCHDFGGEDGTNGESYDFACSACGWCGNVTKPKYCPHCGARVVRDAS